ncbi:hypothetical protein PVAP13_8KG149301 [Panicum virgatum]|uniref:Uncharacterized protein n=1 Tax=Panicum virgatum TaxID=38727 RepID=A0A8T0PLW9_PANVG|nr:hypothetical protein PVAP13_8KG149301 [Panicum virgatum]
MSTPAAARKKKGSGPSALDAAAAAAPAHTLGRGGFSTVTAPSLSRGGFLAPTTRSLGHGGFSASMARSLGSAVAATRPTTNGVGEDAVTAPSSIDGFLFPLEDFCSLLHRLQLGLMRTAVIPLLQDHGTKILVHLVVLWATSEISHTTFI